MFSQHGEQWRPRFFKLRRSRVQHFNHLFERAPGGKADKQDEYVGYQKTVGVRLLQPQARAAVSK